MRAEKLALIALVLLALVLALYRAAKGETAAQTAAQAREILSREEGLIDALDALDRRVIAVAAEQAEAAARRREQAATLAEAEDRLGDVRGRVSAQRERLRGRLRARVRAELAAAPSLLLGAAQPADLLRRRGLLAAVLRADLDLLRQLRGDEVTLAALRQARGTQVDALSAAEAELAERRQALEAERAVQGEVLAGLRAERRLLEAALAQQAAARAALPLEPATEVTGFAAARGQLPMPAPGPVVIGFGRRADPALGTETFHAGLSIAAPAGAPVRAVYRGRVVYSGWYKGFGNLVIIDHGDGHHTLYAHLAAVHTGGGEEVEQGALIGEVGDTGSLRGTQLYFELRADRRSVDPAPWLRGTP